MLLGHWYQRRPSTTAPGRKVDQSRMSSLGSADDGFATTGGRLLPRAFVRLYTAVSVRTTGAPSVPALGQVKSVCLGRHSMLVVRPFPVL